MNPNDRSDDEWARRVLTEAVGDVEPADRLAGIRRRTGQRARRWPLIGGAVLATAAATVIAAVIVGGDNGPSTPEPAPPVATPPSGAPTATTSPGIEGMTPVYYVGDTPNGPRLFREWQRNDDDSNWVFPAVVAAVTEESHDPDYRTPWPDGAGVRSIGIAPDLITVDLTGDLHDRPAGMTAREASLAIQQVVYTAQQAHEDRVPVQLLLERRHSDQILGVPTAEPLTNAAVLETLALVSLDTPVEGQTVTGKTLEASGVASSFEANVPWHVLDADGNRVLEGFATAEGWMGRLYPWRTEIDVSDLEPGEYTFVAKTDDPSGGAEGAGSHADTRTFVVE